MEVDPFASGMLATALSWISAVPMFLAVVGGAVTSVFAPTSVRVKILYAWMLLCALALTPVRYILFQMIAAASYPWQSLRAFLSTFILTIYIPIVFGLLCAVAIAVASTARRTECRLRMRLSLTYHSCPTNSAGTLSGTSE